MNTDTPGSDSASTDIALPGFPEPVLGAQSAFRAILAAMSCPGSLHALGTDLTPPAPLGQAAAAALLCLIDGEAPLAIAPEAAAARAWIAFHCGARFATPPLARFALAFACPDLGALAAGSDEAPEESCTLILQLRALGSGPRFALSGPGLRGTAYLSADGLPADFPEQWAANHALFPRGVDILLCAGDRLAALPRGVRIAASSGAPAGEA